jgi:hypothetical protein
VLRLLRFTGYVPLAGYGGSITTASSLIAMRARKSDCISMTSIIEISSMTSRSQSSGLRLG